MRALKSGPLGTGFALFTLFPKRHSGVPPRGSQPRTLCPALVGAGPWAEGTRAARHCSGKPVSGTLESWFVPAFDMTPFSRRRLQPCLPDRVPWANALPGRCSSEISGKKTLAQICETLPSIILS